MSILTRVDLGREHPQGLYEEVNAIQDGLLGAQGSFPQNVLQWNMDYLELKLLKKGPVQEEYSDPPFCLTLKVGNKPLM